MRNWDEYDTNTEGIYREGEEEIAQSGDWSAKYVYEKLHGRFRAGEEAMKGSGFWSWYVRFLKYKGINI